MAQRLRAPTAVAEFMATIDTHSTCAYLKIVRILTTELSKDRGRVNLA